MKKIIILSIVFALFLTSCDITKTEQVENIKEISDQSTQMKQKIVEVEMVSFQVPEEYNVEHNSGGALASINGDKDSQSGFSLFELKIYKQQTSFETSKEFYDDLETNLITDHIKSNNKKLIDSEIKQELQKYEGRYSFEQKTINDLNILLHKRDFFGMIGNRYDMYVFIDKENILHFVSESDHNELNKIYNSIKKKDQG